MSEVHHVIEKGRDQRVEMFSVFADGFGNKSNAASQDAAKLLHSSGIKNVVVVGVAGDYCVKHTAQDATKEGFHVFVVEEAVRSVDPGAKGWCAVKENFGHKGIKLISIHGPEIASLRQRID